MQEIGATAKVDQARSLSGYWPIWSELFGTVPNVPDRNFDDPFFVARRNASITVIP